MTDRLSDEQIDDAVGTVRHRLIANWPAELIERAIIQLHADLASAKAELAKAKQYMATMAAAGVEATIRERDQAKDALRKISDIRDSIIGGQKINWSEHIYPLVAVLDAAGFPGAGYEVARENLGTLLEQIAAANDKLRAVRAVLHRAEHDALHTKWTSQGIALALREALGMGSEEGA